MGSRMMCSLFLVVVYRVRPGAIVVIMPSPPPGSPVMTTNAPSSIPLDDPSLYFNRELSWLEFNGRVLEEAQDSSVPLLERLKFLAIVASNLDEFFMIRVAGLKQQLSGNVAETPPDGLTAAEQLAAISARTHAMVTEQYRIWRDDIEPGLDAARVRFLRP